MPRKPPSTHLKKIAFSGKTHNAQIDILSDLSGNKTIALRLRSLLIVPLNSWGDIWSLRAWMYYLYIHSLIGSIAHTDLIQRNWAVISTQARDYLPLLLLYNAKLPLNLAIKSPRYAFSQRELHIWGLVYKDFTINYQFEHIKDLTFLIVAKSPLNNTSDHLQNLHQNYVQYKIYASQIKLYLIIRN